MKQYMSMVFFVFVMAVISSGVLLGVGLLTEDRIQANQDAKIKSAILDAHDIPYTIATINETFDEEIDIVVIDGMTFYVNPDTEAVTFVIEGNGVWGPIEGILTLESDFETIVNVTILQQEETPGLGGVIAEQPYLETFVGKVMLPDFQINKDPAPNLPNEIDAIVGATNTSKRFEAFFNTDYVEARAIWLSQND